MLAPSTRHNINVQDYSIVEVSGFTALAKAAQCRHNELGPTITRIFSELTSANPDAELTDAPCLYYIEWRPEDCDIVAALPVSQDTVAGSGSELKMFEPCMALQGVHQGPYEGLPLAWTNIWNYIQENGVNAAGIPWDRYVTDPGTEPDTSQWITEIYVPIQVQRIS